MSDLIKHGRRTNFRVFIGSASRAIDGNPETDLRGKVISRKLLPYATTEASDRGRKCAANVELDGIS